METAIQHLLDIQAIEPVPKETGILFHTIHRSKDFGWVESDSTSKKPEYSFGLQEIPSVHLAGEGNFLVSIDLMEAYLHVPILPAHHQFLRFQYAKGRYQYRALPFGLASTPRCFTKVLAALAAHLRSIPMRLQCYLDNILIQASSPSQA